MLKFFFGDVHGCFTQLIALLSECRAYANGRPSKHIFLGDLIDRGPESCSVVQTIIDMQIADPSNVIALCGNHEDLLRHTESDDGLDHWVMNGGSATLRSYGVSSPKDIPSEHLNWLRTLPVSYDDGQRYFVHAGIRPGIPLDQQRRRDLPWIREPFLSSSESWSPHRPWPHAASPRRTRYSPKSH